MLTYWSLDCKIIGIEIRKYPDCQNKKGNFQNPVKSIFESVFGIHYLLPHVAFIGYEQTCADIYDNHCACGAEGKQDVEYSYEIRVYVRVLSETSADTRNYPVIFRAVHFIHIIISEILS